MFFVSAGKSDFLPSPGQRDGEAAEEKQRVPGPGREYTCNCMTKCVVAYCIVLCCVVLCCIVLYCIVLYRIVLYCIVVLGHIYTT